jgi:uncharacterized protein
MKILFPAAFLILLIFTSCQEKDDGPQSNLDQTELLTNIGENLIVKGYEDFLTKAEMLSMSASAFSENPSSLTLNDLRAKWLSVYLSWQKVAFYSFGPAETNAMITINFYPVDTGMVKDNITSGNYSLFAAENTFAKGFPALDYLLYGYADSEEGIIEKFINNENAGIYVTDLATNILSLAENVHNLWSPSGSNYLETFKSNKGTSAGSSLSMLVNSWSQYMEIHVRNAKIGIPNGNSVATDQKFDPFPEKSEAYYSRTYSKDLLKTANNALKDFYIGKGHDGTDGVGIQDMLIELDAQNGTLAGDYLQLFADVDNQINQLEGTWGESILTGGEKVTAIFNKYKAIIALLKVDIVSALSVSITYTDNDGD